MTRIVTASVAFACLLALPCAAQWPRYVPQGTPVRSDGKPNLEAPAPRSADGKPDLSGTWQSVANGLARDVAEDLNPEDVLPWARSVYRERLLTLGKDVPASRCLPPSLVSLNFFPGSYIRIVQTPAVTAILYGGERDFLRMVYTDGRKLPDDSLPAWLGYSVGHWEGDTLVASTSGFNDRSWLDFNGRPQTESLRVTERFQRRDFGHMQLEMTLEDPKVFARAFSIKGEKSLTPDYAPPEAVCENNRDPAHLTGGNGFRMSPEQLAEYEGLYEFAPGRQVSLTTADIFMTFQERPNGLKRTLVPQSEREFIFRDNGDDIVFEKNSSGAVTQFTERRAVGDRTAVRRGNAFGDHK